MNKLVVTTYNGSIYIVDIEKETISGGRFGEATVSFTMVGSLMIGDTLKGFAFFDGDWWAFRTSTVEKIARV